VSKCLIVGCVLLFLVDRVYDFEGESGLILVSSFLCVYRIED
jgi:hypothetical protein